MCPARLPEYCSGVNKRRCPEPIERVERGQQQAVGEGTAPELCSSDTHGERAGRLSHEGSSEDRERCLSSANQSRRCWSKGDWSFTPEARLRHSRIKANSEARCAAHAQGRMQAPPEPPPPPAKIPIHKICRFEVSFRPPTPTLFTPPDILAETSISYQIRWLGDIRQNWQANGSSNSGILRKRTQSRHTSAFFFRNALRCSLLRASQLSESTEYTALHHHETRAESEGGSNPAVLPLCGERVVCWGTVHPGSVIPAAASSPLHFPQNVTIALDDYRTKKTPGRRRWPRRPQRNTASVVAIVLLEDEH